jgi:hypothetical protein
MRGRGAMTLLVSGGFTAFAQPVADMLGFERVVANRFEVREGCLSGLVDGEIVEARTKCTALEQTREGFRSESRVMHINLGMPLISAEHEPHLPALQFQRTAKSGADSAWIWCTASSTTMPSVTSVE